MKFRNYCLVVMGNTKNVLPEIIKIAETKPNILDAKGIVVVTFASIMEPKELTDYFELNGRNFLLFDLNPEFSGFYFEKQDIMEGLFGFLKLMDEEGLKQRTDELMDELSSTTVTKAVKKTGTKGSTISVEDIDRMSADEKNKLMNFLIEKGVKKSLSDNDKKLLEKLTA